MHETIYNNRKRIILLLLVVIIGIIGYAIYIPISRIGKLPVTLVTVPRDSRVTIDNASFANGTIYLKPNTRYNVTVSKDGFSTDTQSVYIGQDDRIIAAALLASSEQAKKWVEENQDKYLALEKVRGEAASQKGETAQTNNPIISLLPFSNYLYTIGYKARPTDPSGTSIIVTINASDGYRQAALQQIEQWGYDPTGLSIEFTNYRNPFTL